MKWTEEFQDPGPAPTPPGAEPSMTNNADRWVEWSARFRIYNRWVVAMRKHLVAKALDELEGERRAPGSDHTIEPPKDPITTIALVLGTAYLQGDNRATNVLDFLGGL